jgi:ribonuclease HI
MKQAIIFTDASYWTDNGKTAVAYVMIHDNGDIRSFAGTVGHNKTIHRAELYAVVFAIESMRVRCKHDVTIYTDCLGNVEAQDKPLTKRNDVDLWRKLNAVNHKVRLEWIRRDSHPYMIEVDSMARNCLQKWLIERGIK